MFLSFCYLTACQKEIRKRISKKFMEITQFYLYEKLMEFFCALKRGKLRFSLIGLLWRLSNLYNTISVIRSLRYCLQKLIAVEKLIFLFSVTIILPAIKDVMLYTITRPYISCNNDSYFLLWRLANSARYFKSRKAVSIPQHLL